MVPTESPATERPSLSSGNKDRMLDRGFTSFDMHDTKYELFKLLNQEIAFEVDVSKVPCGIAASAQLGEMAADGGVST